jgi:hypothetical protein
MMILTLRKNHSLKPPTNQHTMQIKTKHLLTMLVVAGISSAALPAGAATVIPGDLLFGFRVTGGVGAGTDLIVRANPAGTTGGNATVFRDASASIPSVLNLGTELSTIYGNDWHTRGDLFWGVVGVRSASSTGGGNGTNGAVPGRSPFVGIAQGTSTPGVQSSAAPDLSGAAGLRTNTSNAINAINSAFTATTDNGISSAEAIYLASNTLGGWTAQVTEDYFDLGSGAEVANASGIDNSGLDLYWILNSNTGATDNGAAVASTVGVGVYQGSFQINNSGVVSFNAVAAIPEPSRTLFAGMGLVALLFRRRRA